MAAESKREREAHASLTHSMSLDDQTCEEEKCRALSCPCFFACLPLSRSLACVHANLTSWIGIACISRRESVSERDVTDDLCAKGSRKEGRMLHVTSRVCRVECSSPSSSFFLPSSLSPSSPLEDKRHARGMSRRLRW